MNPRPALAAAFLLALSASGCVAFEHAPVTTLACDPDLVGRWHADRDGPGPGREIVVDAKCQAQWPVHERAVEVSLRGYTQGATRYVVLSPEHAQRMLGSESEIKLKDSVPRHAVFMVAYRIDGDRLQAWLPDPDRVNAAIRDGKARGRPLQNGDASSVLVQGKARSIAQLLAQGPEPVFGPLKPEVSALQLQRVAGTLPAATSPGAAP